jgi:protease I
MLSVGGTMVEKEQLRNFRVAILATDGVEEVELIQPKKALEEAGAQTTVIAPKAGKLQAFKHFSKASKIEVDLPLEQAKPGDFDGVLLPGGALNADSLRMEEGARVFVREMNADGKPMAAICHAPWLLVSAELARGRAMTGWGSIQDDLRNAGAAWRDQPVVVDGNLVTSRGPDDLPMFNEAMIRLFAAGYDEVSEGSEPPSSQDGGAGPHAGMSPGP